MTIKLFDTRTPDTEWSKLTVTPEIRKSLIQIVRNYRQRDELRTRGLSNPNKISICGPSGTGKYTTANVMARATNLQLYVVHNRNNILDSACDMIDHIYRHRGVYLFDECTPATFIKQILHMDPHTLDSLIVVAGDVQNQYSAMSDCFDVRLQYQYPTRSEVIDILRNHLAPWDTTDNLIDIANEVTSNLSHGEIVRACQSAVASIVLVGGDTVDVDTLCREFENIQ